MKKVSVIIPFYSHKEWLEEAIQSVIEQAYDNVEIVLVNDGSADDISAIVNKYQHRIRYVSQENKGAAAARNVGISIASGDYIAFLDADDLWMPDKLEKQITSMEKSGCKWSHSSYLRFDSNGCLGCVDNGWFRGNVFPKILARNPIATPCVIIQSAVLIKDDSLRFKEEYRYGEDSFLWMNLAQKYELLCIEEPLVKVRMHGDNAAKSAFAQLEARNQMFLELEKEDFKGIPKSYQKPFILSHKAFEFEKTRKRKSELRAKLLYVIPWLLFRKAGK